MRNIYLPICLVSILLSCSPKENAEKEKQVKETANQEKIDAENAAIKKKRFEEYLPDFQKLVINYDGVVRGIDIGTELSKLQETETAKLTSSAPDKLVYHIDLSDDESAEITYFLENSKVNGIEYEIGQGSTDEVSAFILEFTDFFTNKFGPVIPTENDSEVWKTPTGHEIRVVDVSKGNKFGLIVIVRK